MPLIGTKPPPPMNKETRWGRPKEEVRLVMVEPGGKHAVYVVEEAPGVRRVLYMSHSYKLWLPWIYFFIRVSRGCRLSKEAPAYVLIANERQETLREKGLRIPALPNLFAHGGICTYHQSEFRGSAPLASVRAFVRWFWASEGNTFFRNQSPAPLALGRNGYPGLRKWQSMTPEEVLKVDWRVPKLRSVYEAAEKLRFKYWAFGWDNSRVSDMAAKATVMRKELK